MFSSNATQVSSANYIEDVFSTYLYTGTGANLTINNGIDLAGKGGLTWFKSRSGAYNNALLDTARGTNKALFSNSTAANSTFSYLTSFNSNGVTFPGSYSVNNNSGATYALWTFRKQPKFFDIVTYTGNAAARTIAHSLGSVPGSIWIKRTDSTSNWAVYHKDLGVDQGYTGKDFHIFLNLTNAQDGISDYWNNTAPTSTVFSLGANAAVNTNGATYVAYLFAHNAGGFGLTGTDNVISCGSFTTNASNQFSQVSLGYEPQWILYKNTTGPANWNIFDNMRGFSVDNATANNDAGLYPNTSGAEVLDSAIQPNATGFISTATNSLSASSTYIYIAIRRGPMKVPTSGTSVFAPVAATAPSSPYTVTTNFPVDLTINSLSNSSSGKNFNDRLRGGTTTSYVALDSTGLAAEATGTGFGIGFNSNTSIIDNGWESGTGNNAIWWNFRRAPSYFDEVCYTGNRVSGSTTQTLTHNLGATPELMIVKSRSTSYDWFVYSATLGATKYLSLRSTIGSTTTVNPNSYWNETAPTSTQFTVGANNNINGSGVTFVAYLFATCAGVSKVGSYTGTGATQTISCGFTGGARFVLVKRVDSTGDWYVWDTARGMVAGTDPSLLLNSTAAEVNANSIYTTTGGFQIVSTAAGINASGGTYIFLAIA